MEKVSFGKKMSITMDNAAFHKSERTKEFIENANCKLIFLPSYSPHLNPIEQFWAVLKRRVYYLINESDSLMECVSQVLPEC